MTTTASPSYGAAQAHTITLAGLASDDQLAAGRAGAAISNITNDAIDAILGGKITTGAAPLGSRIIQIFIYGQYDVAGANYSGGASGADQNLTPIGAKALMRLAYIIPTTATPNAPYTFLVGSVAALFGGILPPKWGVFIVHNSGDALNGTAGNHEIKHTPVKFESV